MMAEPKKNKKGKKAKIIIHPSRDDLMERIVRILERLKYGRSK